MSVSDSGPRVLRTRPARKTRRRWSIAAVLVAVLVPLAAAAVAEPAAANVNGTVYTWGGENFGDLGNGGGITDSTLVPTPDAGPDVRFTQIASDASHFLALAADGTVWGWGDNTRDQVLGQGFNGPVYQPAPIQIPGLTNVRQVAVGGPFSLAVTWDGTVYQWGEDLTIGDNVCDNCITDIPQPTQVSGVSGIVAIAADATHALMLSSSGAVYGWGDNTDGVLGTGDTSRRAQPTRISLPVPATAIATGIQHSLVLGSNNLIYGFGDNSAGELGQGANTPTQSLTAIPVLGISSTTPVLQVAAGTDDSFALLSGGTIVAWGDNQYGTLGVGGTADRSLPTQVPSLSGVSSIVAGGLDTIALSGGTVWTWGYNAGGALGLGTTGDPVTTPQQVPNLSGVVAVGMDISVGAAAVDPASTISAHIFPNAATVVAGTSVGTQLTLAPSSDEATQSWSFGLTGAPTGVSAGACCFGAPAGTPAPLTISTTTATPPGTYTLTFTFDIGATGPPQSTVTFTLTVTPAPVTVPNVLSFSQASAVSAIQGAGLTVGSISQVNNCVDPGSVQTQNPSGGAQVARGTAVNLSVSTCTGSGGGGGGGGNPRQPK